jgi:hypothetical protein
MRGVEADGAQCLSAGADGKQRAPHAPVTHLPYLPPRSAASNNKDKGRTPKRQRSTTPPHRRDKTISLSALQTLVAAADDDEQLPTHAPPACAQGHEPVTAAEEPTPAARGRAT